MLSIPADKEFGNPRSITCCYNGQQLDSKAALQLPRDLGRSAARRLHRRRRPKSLLPSPRRTSLAAHASCVAQLAAATRPQRKGGRDGARDGIRTHDTRDHNPVLCQLSYSRHRHGDVALSARNRQGSPTKGRHTFARSCNDRGAGRRLCHFSTLINFWPDAYALCSRVQQQGYVAA